MRKQALILSAAVLAVCSLSFTAVYQQNTAPVVKITSPKVITYTPGSPVSYGISVADKEDGDSKFDEINGLEVLLEVKFVEGTAKAAASAADEAGLTIMRTSNCFNCHNFNSKLIGPSFNDIARKYPASAANVALMVKHIKEGSVGVWGKTPMPTHAELTNPETETAVKWMFKQAADPNVTYYTGLEGVLKTRAAKGSYVITASYTDHGPKASPGKQRLTGKDVVVLQSR